MECATENAITLKGSVDLIVDYFFYAVNSILYQRGIYPEAYFKRNTKYELSVLIAADEELIRYLKNILNQLRDWLHQDQVQQLVLVVKCPKTDEILERWQFKLKREQPPSEHPVLSEQNPSTASDNAKPTVLRSKKTIAQIQGEIRDVIRQIVASNTFLPSLDRSCTFELLVYTDKSANVPTEWEESGPQYVNNACEVKLRSFSTTIHKVDNLVSYKLNL